VSVVFFHVGFDWFGGGFVGVDVFFVISGFLITRLIRDEVVENGSFSFSNFYTRRARRLFPALFFTLCLCFVFAVLLFSPQHLERFGGALLHTLLSISNFYFWLETGYFDTEAEFKPLLHTWSLSVEEQFYMVWPLVLVLLLRRTPPLTAPILLLVGGIVSVGLAWHFEHKNFAFFLAPFRAYEFAIGAILVWLIRFQPSNRLVLEPLVLVGLAMILYATVAFSYDTPFPSINALIPCLGTGLIVYAGTARYSGRLLSNRIAVGIGLISYSLYLIHWPIIAFYRYWKFGELTLIEQLAICAVSVVAAALMYRYIERPFRRGAAAPGAWSRAGFGFGCAMLTLVLILPAASTWANSGWPWRIDREAAALLRSAKDRDVQLTAACKYRIDHKPDDAFWARFSACVDAHGPAVLVVGDSHGTDLFNSLAYNADIAHVAGITVPGCRPHTHKDHCHYEEARRFVYENKANIRGVIYTQKGGYFLHEWIRLPIAYDLVDSVSRYLETLVDSGLPIVWVGPQKEILINPSKMANSIFSPMGARMIYSERRAIHDLDDYLISYANDKPYVYVSKLKTDEAQVDYPIIVDNKFTYSDGDHWSAVGEVIFGKQLIEGNRILAELLMQ